LTSRPSPRRSWALRPEPRPYPLSPMRASGLSHKSRPAHVYMIWAICPPAVQENLVVTYSSHYCSRSQKYFNIDLSDVALSGSHYTRRVTQLAVRLVVEDGLPSRPASGHLWRRSPRLCALCHPPELDGGWGEKRRKGRWTVRFWTGRLRPSRATWQLMNSMRCPPVCSRPSTIAVQRMLSTVLDHDPKHDESSSFWARFKTAVADRTFVLKGIRHDGSALYPEPIRQVFGEVPHQLCTFHVLKELTQGS